MRIGIDLGGTKIEGLLLAGDGREVARERIDTPRDDYDAALAAIAGLVESLASKTGSETIGAFGVGMPGSLSPRDGLVRNANAICINGKDLHKDLEAITGCRVRLANDANCFALSEASDGAGQGAHCVFGVILGTGVGGGLVVAGQLIEGRNRVGGEWGHNPLPRPQDHERPGPTCYCGRQGCIESFLSGPALAHDHAITCGQKLRGPEIVAAAEAGDPDAMQSLARYEGRFARALASVINLFDPDVIVLGGGLSNIGRIYENVPELWLPHVFSDSVETRLVPATHGDSGGVRGAAWLWPEAGS